jgi:hypothetical protein
MYPETKFSRDFEKSLMFYALPDGVHDTGVSIFIKPYDDKLSQKPHLFMFSHFRVIILIS